MYIFMYFRSMYPWMWSVDTWFLYFTDVIVSGNVRSPLLAFCDAVMASVSAVGSKPNHKLSEECVQCVLHENRVDLLAHWISQERYKSLYKDINLCIKSQERFKSLFEFWSVFNNKKASNYMWNEIILSSRYAGCERKMEDKIWSCWGWPW